MKMKQTLLAIVLTLCLGLTACGGSAPAAELILQQDGLLRLTVTGSDTASQTWYMMRSYSAALDRETGETP